MIKTLVFLGLFIVVLGGSLAELSEPSASQNGAQEVATAAPTAVATPEIVTNRADCSTIRGTEYLGPEERVWFLANCLTR